MLLAVDEKDPRVMTHKTVMCPIAGKGWADQHDVVKRSLDRAT